MLRSRRICRVIDGDTVVLCQEGSTSEEGEHLRLYGIDAPESRQVYGIESRVVLVAMLQRYDNTVFVQIHGNPEKYGRRLATLYVSPQPRWAIQNVNYLMVRKGHAWSYRFQKEEMRRGKLLVPVTLDAYDEAEREARQERIGLWAPMYGQAQRPSDYRAAKRRRQRRRKSLKRYASM